MRLATRRAHIRALCYTAALFLTLSTAAWRGATAARAATAQVSLLRRQTAWTLCSHLDALLRDPADTYAVQAARAALDALPLSAQDAAPLRQLLAALPALTMLGEEAEALEALRAARRALEQTPPEGYASVLHALRHTLADPLSALPPEQGEPRFLAGQAFVSGAAASAIPAAIFPAGGGWTVGEDTGDDLPCYRFEQEDCVVLVTKVGGLLRSFVDGRAPGEAVQTPAQTAASAAVWLKQQGFADDCPLRLIEQEEAAGCLRLRFAPVRDGEVHTGESVLLTAAPDGGTPLSFDATAYLRRHERSAF